MLETSIIEPPRETVRIRNIDTVSYSIAEECLINCYCEEYRVECTLFSCTDEINTEYDEVVIHGTLCQSHRYTLTHIIQDTLIILKDDICEVSLIVSK